MHVKCSIQTLETQSAVERIARAGRERQRQYYKFELCEYPQPVPATTNCLKWVWTITSRSTRSMRSGREGNSQSSYLLFFLFLLVRSSGCVQRTSSGCARGISHRDGEEKITCLPICRRFSPPFEWWCSKMISSKNNSRKQTSRCQQSSSGIWYATPFRKHSRLVCSRLLSISRLIQPRDTFNKLKL